MPGKVEHGFVAYDPEYDIYVTSFGDWIKDWSPDIEKAKVYVKPAPIRAWVKQNWHLASNHRGRSKEVNKARSEIARRIQILAVTRTQNTAVDNDAIRRLGGVATHIRVR